MKKTTIISVMAVLCLNFSLAAQEIKPLKIGDKVPESFWQQEHTIYHEGKTAKQNLSAYKGKLLILDFWATWCGSCIAAMPNLHQLQVQLNDRIAIVAVTATPAKETISFIKKNTILKNLALTSITDDNLLKRIFPHTVIPHLVWITPDGYFKAATGSDQVKLHTVQQLLNGEQQSLRQKVDLDKSALIFLQENLLAATQIKSYALFFKGIYDGLPSGHKEFIDSNQNLTGLSSTNLPLIEIYEKAIYALFKEKGIVYTYKRRLLNMDVQTSQHLVKDEKMPGLFSDKDDLYTYTKRGLPQIQFAFYTQMLADLNANAPFTGTIENKEVKCMVLRQKGNGDLIQTKGGPSKQNWLDQKDCYIRNYPIAYMVKRINASSNIPLLLIDETGYTKNVDIAINGELNQANLMNSLQKYGLELREEIRLLDFFVISKKAQQ